MGCIGHDYRYSFELRRDINDVDPLTNGGLLDYDIAKGLRLLVVSRGKVSEHRGTPRFPCV